MLMLDVRDSNFMLAFVLTENINLYVEFSYVVFIRSLALLDDIVIWQSFLLCKN